MRLSKLTTVAAVAFASFVGVVAPSIAAAALDVRVAWAYDGIPDPGSYAPNPVPADFNELKGNFLSQAQTAGDNAANLHDAIAPYGLTGVGVTWDGWRRFNSNDPGAFASDRDWVDRAGSGSQLSGTDTGGPTAAFVTFTGLVPNNPYQVEVVMTGIGGTSWTVQIDASYADHSFSNTAGQNAALTAWNSSINGTAQRDWLVWDSASADSSGTLQIYFASMTNAGTDGLHAIRISGPVPEPASLGLLAIAGTGLFARRRPRQPADR